MNRIIPLSLKVLRKIYTKYIRISISEKPESEQNPDIISKIIYDELMADKPSMVARFGSTELTCLKNYVAVKSKNRNIIDFIRGKSSGWWWEQSIIDQMQNWSGFFPPDIQNIELFCELMLKDIKKVDILGSWLSDESLFEKELINAKKVRFIFLEPFWSKEPWTRALKNKKVLVIHPFSTTIEHQYKKRELLFKNDLLPKFELITIKAVQSIAGSGTEFKNWFEALNSMKTEIDKADFDICLIGAGAYGFPLAAYVKSIGKKSVHLGGSLQLLFGIKGKRWENIDYAKDAKLNYQALFNEHWVRPLDEEKPKNSEKVEDNCYW